MFDNRVPHMLDDDYTPRSASTSGSRTSAWCSIGKDCACRCRWPRPPPGGDDGRRPGLGPIDDAGFVKVYESFTGKRIAAARDSDKRG